MGAGTELMARDLWNLALRLGSVKTRLDLFLSGMELNHLALDQTQTLGTALCVCSGLSESSHCTSSSHAGPCNAFLATL